MPTRVHYNITFLVLMISAVAYALLQSLLLPAIPTLEHELHTSQDNATWLLTAYLLSAAIATPILGRLGDTHGKKRLSIIVLSILAVGTLIAALSTTLSVMLVGRVLQGVGGAIFPLAFGIIRDEFPQEKVATGIGLISAVLGVGAGLGIVMSGPILEHLSYHWLYWIPLIMVVTSLVFTILVIPESLNIAKGRVNINWKGGVLMTGWLVTLLVAISEAPSWGWTDTKVLVLFAATIVLILAWIRSESRSETPLVDMSMMKIPTVWRTNASALLLGFGMFAIMVTVPAFVQTDPKYGYGFAASATQSGLYLVPLTLAMLLVAPLTGRIAARVGSKPPLAVGALVTGLGYVVLSIGHAHAWCIYLATGIAGVGIGLAFAAMTNLVVEAVPREQTGVATAMNTNVRNIGAALGSGIATSLVVSTTFADGVPKVHGYVMAFIVCAVVLGLSALVAGTIPRRRSAQPDPESHTALASEAEVFAGVALFPEE